jgi:hypothetical protein
MSELVLTTDQLAALSAAESPVVVRDAQGEVVGYYSKRGSYLANEAEIILKALESIRTPGPRYTTQEVLDYLRTLEPS